MQLQSSVSTSRTRLSSTTLPWPGTGRLEYPRAPSPVFDGTTHPDTPTVCAPDDAFRPPPADETGHRLFAQLVDLFRATLQGSRKPETGAPIWLKHRFFNAAITACARVGQAEMAIERFDDMLESQLPPDTGSCNGVLQACRNGGRPDLAIGFLRDMLMLGIRPDVGNFNMAFEACLKDGSFETAKHLFDYLVTSEAALGVKPDRATWRALITACHAIGKPDDAALRMLESLPAEDPIWQAVTDSGIYHQMLATCTTETASKLLARGIAASVYRPGLGFNGMRNTLDLRERALFRSHPPENRNKAVHPALAKTIFAEQMLRGKIDRDTCYVMGNDAPPQLLATIRRCRHAQGWPAALPPRPPMRARVTGQPPSTQPG